MYDCKNNFITGNGCKYTTFLVESFKLFFCLIKMLYICCYILV
jgi:hypothetical protein